MCRINKIKEGRKEGVEELRKKRMGSRKGIEDVRKHSKRGNCTISKKNKEREMETKREEGDLREQKILSVRKEKHTDTQAGVNRKREKGKAASCVRTTMQQGLELL